MDGLRVRYLAAGTEGPEVLLVHGASPDCAPISWRETIPELSKHHRVFAVDLPGHGRSSKPLTGYSLQHYVGFLERFMEAVGIEKASLVGLSLGGGASLGLAMENPETVDRLVLVDSYGLRGRPPLPLVSQLLRRATPVSRAYSALLRNRRILEWSLGRLVCGSPGNVSEELVDEVLARVRDPKTGRVSAAIREAELGSDSAREEYARRLGELRQPTLIAHGRRDRLIPVSCSERAHREIPGSRLHVFEDCGHWPPRERPAEFNRVVVGFLRDAGVELDI